MYHKTQISIARILTFILPIFSAVLCLFSWYNFSRLDQLINVILYQYGLQFSLNWASNYWTYAKSFLALALFACVLSLASSVLNSIKPGKSGKINTAKIINPTLVLIGIVALTISIAMDSSILAFIGLGLIFWGLVFAYIRTDEYVKKNLFEISVSSLSSSLNQIIHGIGCEGKPVYLPPKYFKDPDTQKIFISKLKDVKIPTSDYIQNHELTLSINNPDGILLTPPGVELFKFFEKTLKTSFLTIDLRYLKENLPKLFIEDLKIAKNFEMEIMNNQIQVKIEHSIFNIIRKDNVKNGYISQLGSLIASSIAIAINKATGKLLTIEKEESSVDGKRLTIVYLILDEKEVSL